MDNNHENEVLDLYKKRDMEKEELAQDIEKRFQEYKKCLDYSDNKALMEAKERKKKKYAKREFTKKVTLITTCVFIGTAALAGYNSVSLTQKLVDIELDKVDEAAKFSANIDEEYVAENYPNFPYVTSKYISDIINYENNNEIDKTVYYDEMIAYIFYHSRDVLDDVFKNIKEYINNNECSADLKRAFYYDNFDEYLKAHNFDSVADFDRRMSKFMAEKAKDEDSDKIEIIANEHNFTLDNDENQGYGGR